MDKKDFGKPVEHVPLPKATDLPVVHRMKTEAAPTKTATPKVVRPPWSQMACYRRERQLGRRSRIQELEDENAKLKEKLDNIQDLVTQAKSDLDDVESEAQ